MFRIKQSKRRKLIRWLTVAIFLLMAGCAGYLSIYSKNIIRQRVNTYVLNATNHEYSLSFSGIRTSIWSRSISIDALELIPLKSEGKHYYFSAKEIKVIGISGSSLLFDQELIIQRISIREPEFELHDADSLSAEEIEKNDLFDKLQPFFGNKLNSVSIGEIRLLQAKANQYTQVADSSVFHSISDFNIVVEDFYLDQSVLAKRQELFRAGEIYFQIQDYRRIMGDQLHRLHVDELIYSIQNKTIRGKNISLSPIRESDHLKTRYWIEVPEIRLKSGNLRSIIEGDSLKVDSLQLLQANIRVKPPRYADGLNLRKISDFDLYQLFRDDFSRITISRLILESRKLRFESRTADEDLFQEFTNIRVEGENFELDSTAYLREDKILYSDDFVLTVGSYQLRLNDKVHRFEAKNITASSAEKLIKAENLQLIPAGERKELPATVRLSCDSIRFLSVDLARLFHHREMPLQEISAFKPEVNIQQFRDAAEKNRDHTSLLYHFIGDYIKGIYAQVIAIDQGHFQISDLRNQQDSGHIEASFNFRLTDFSLDSVSARRTDKLFYATNLELSFRDYQMKLADQLHKLEIARLEASSIQKLVSISGFHLYPETSDNPETTLRRLNRSERYRIKIPSVYLRNTDIHHAFFEKKLNINNISIVKPEIYYEVFARLKKSDNEFNPEELYELLNNYIEHIEIGGINVTNGAIRFVNHSRKGKTIDLTNKFSVKLDRFVLNDNELKKNRLFFADEFELRIMDHLFKLSDNVHLLRAKEISLGSKDSTMTISNALLYPNIASAEFNSMPWHIQVNIPKVKLNGVNPEQVYFNQVLKVRDLQIDSPTIEIYRNGKPSGKFNFKDLTVPLPEEMKELSIRKVALTNGKLKIYNTDRFNQQQIAGSDLNFSIDGASLKRPENIKTARFTSDNIETSLSALKLTPEKVPYTIGVETVNYSSAKKQLSFTNLDIQSTRDGDDRTISSIQMPVLRFEQLDPVDAFQDNRFHAQLIRMAKPVFRLNITDQEQDGNPFYLKLPADLQQVMDELSAEKVIVEDAGFYISAKKEKISHQHVDITLDQFSLDSTLSEKPFGAKTLSIVKRDHRFTDQKRWYDFVIDKISYSGTDNRMSFSGIEIKPRYSKDDYQRIIPFQADYYSGKIGHIDFSGIDIDRWFDKKEFTGRLVLINSAQVNIYRDKRKEFNEKQRPPMPQQLVREFELPFYFDTVKLLNSDISYAEQLENMPAPGLVKFGKLNGKIYPFTNLPYLINTRPEVRFDASAWLMNESELKVNMTFNMNSDRHRFHVSGRLSPFDMRMLNPITENNALILVRSGQVNRFDFEFNADEDKASGKLRFAYDDLKVSILEQKDGDTKEAKFASFMANSLMLKSKNPRTRILLPDDIYFERDKQRSIINYWWKSVFSGAKNTFRIKDEKEE
ncbi:hypothetical protein [Gaoshiqia sp. Z1-71]|uniref:hypothetical protein n=1 Tax=Gaoshiqia hydrogeniformans TaxID=3290090 RepID=UPI003BF8C4BC